jgi:hypothetical protein
MTARNSSMTFELGVRGWLVSPHDPRLPSAQRAWWRERRAPSPVLTFD